METGSFCDLPWAQSYTDLSCDYTREASNIFCVIVNSCQLEVSNTSWRQYSEDGSSICLLIIAMLLSSFTSFPESIYIVLNQLFLNRGKRKVDSYVEKWLACENLEEGGDRMNLVYPWYPKIINLSFRTLLQSIKQFIDLLSCVSLCRNPQKTDSNWWIQRDQDRKKQVQKQHKYRGVPELVGRNIHLISTFIPVFTYPGHNYI